MESSLSCENHITLLEVIFGLCWICFCSKGGGAVVQRFDKSLEEFYAVCDQIELNLVSVFAHILLLVVTCRFCLSV